jgi:hypothetical protein
MSRSFKKVPAIKDATCKKYGKKYANKKVRKIDIGGGGAYKKAYESYNICDYVLPEHIRLAKSNIHGKGIFATASIPKHTNIALAKINNQRTLVGRYTNHSNVPNCTMVLLDNGDIELHSLTDIVGCLGGQLGDELTVNYRDVLTLQSKLIKGN